MIRLVTVLVAKEFKRIFRNVFMLRLIFMIPVVQLLILPFAAEFEMRNMKVCVIDNDNSQLSRRLADEIGASKYFDVTAREKTFAPALALIEQNRCDAVVEIPRGFEKNARNVDEAGGFGITMNAINGVKSGLGASYLNNIIGDFRAAVAADSADFRPPEPFAVQFRYNEYLNYKAYIVPGVVVFVISLIGGLLATLNVVSEKEAGTIEQMQVVPLSNYLFLTTKIIPIWILGMAILTIGLFIAHAVYGLVPRGNVFLIYAFAAVYLAAFTSFGLILSSYSSTSQQAMLTFMFFMMIFLLMSGLFTPISSMPHWAQIITLFNPVRYFVEVMRAIFLKGAGFADIWQNFAAICAFAAAFNLMGVFAHRR